MVISFSSIKSGGIRKNDLIRIQTPDNRLFCQSKRIHLNRSFSEQMFCFRCYDKSQNFQEKRLWMRANTISPRITLKADSPWKISTPKKILDICDRFLSFCWTGSLSVKTLSMTNRSQRTVQHSSPLFGPKTWPFVCCKSIDRPIDCDGQIQTFLDETELREVRSVLRSSE